MTLADFIAKAVPALADLKEALLAARDRAPDLAPMLDPKIAALESVADPAGLVQLGTTVLHELSDPSKFLTNPKAHPSDLA